MLQELRGLLWAWVLGEKEVVLSWALQKEVVLNGWWEEIYVKVREVDEKDRRGSPC